MSIRKLDKKMVKLRNRGVSKWAIAERWDYYNRRWAYRYRTPAKYRAELPFKYKH